MGSDDLFKKRHAKRRMAGFVEGDIEGSAGRV